jgi:hypothetical protein
MKAWITVERVKHHGEEHTDTYYYIWSTEPEWNEIDEKWNGESGTAADICSEILMDWLGHVPRLRECIELNVTEGTTWLPTND